MADRAGRIGLTVAQALGLVAAVASGLAALRHPTRAAADALLDLAFLLTVAAAIAAACGRGPSRRFAAGFAIAASAYLAIHLIPAYPIHPDGSSYRPAAIRLLDACFEAVPRPEMVSTRGGPITPMTRTVRRSAGEEVTVVGTSPTPAEQAILDEYYDQIDAAGYRRLGHAVLAPVAGIAGGLLGLLVGTGRRPDRRLED